MQVVSMRRLQSSSLAQLSRQSRGYASSSSYVPARSRHDATPAPVLVKPKPLSPTFFSGRASFNDTVLKLEDSIKEAQYSLRKAHVLPPSGTGSTKGRSRLVVGGAQWKNAEDMAKLFDSTKKLPTGDHRRILQLLAQLNEYRSLLQAALSNPRTSSALLHPHPTSRLPPYLGASETRKEPIHPVQIYENLDKLLNPFQRASYISNIARQQAEQESRASAGDEEEHVLESVGSRAKGSKAHLDEYGRAYALGRRKESSARVWLVPTKVPRFRDEIKKDQTLEVPATSSATPSADASSPETPKAAVDSPAHARFLETMKSSFSSATNASVAQFSPPSSPTGVTLTPTISQILINNTPLHLYFANPIDREKVVFPFKATGTVGKYNVFALVRGGGTTGQAGAVAVGIARAVRTLFPAGTRILKGCKCIFASLDLWNILFSAHVLFFLDDLLRRDPRMVERKKTGLAKARKRVCFQRFFLSWASLLTT